MMFQALDNGDVELTQMANISNDYFCTEFLLNFPQAGNHTLKIDCRVLDSNDISWDIDCNSEISVKSFREKKHSSTVKP